MGFVENLKKLARIVPGVAGYQDREASGDTDKLVRLKLSAEIEVLKLETEEEKRRWMEVDDFSLLPALDSVASKLDKTANLIKYAERGYTGLFDNNRVDQDKLDKLYSFDLSLFDEIEILKVAMQGLRGSSSDASAAREEVRKMDKAIEGFGRKFSTRRDLLISL